VPNSPFLQLVLSLSEVGRKTAISVWRWHNGTGSKVCQTRQSSLFSLMYSMTTYAHFKDHTGINSDIGLD